MLKKLYQKKESTNLKLNIPNHLAIIMDGNARWAKSRGLPIQIGHKNGAKNLKKIAENCIDLGVKILSVYAFSTENWDRPKQEVDYLLELLEDYLDQEKEQFIKKNITLVISGNLDRVDTKLRNKITEIANYTTQNNLNKKQNLILNVAFSYGSRQEIVDATKKIIKAIEDKKINIDEIDENLFASNLYQSDFPDPDLLIRTAGDQRLSNFFLWQSAYCELYFTKVFWPDFNKKTLLEAIKNYNQRDRKYGKR
jgi:undecaprenyl diphosphate synthase